MDSGYTIFFVDDVEVSRRLIESTLGQLYDVETFASGQACLDRLAVKTPDLFLLDVDMPEMDGYTLCRHIKERAGIGGSPVIFISGLDDLESRLAGYDAGGEDFIVKPYKLAELKQKVAVLRRLGEEKSSLRSRAHETDLLASQVLSNLEEYSVLVGFLRSLNSRTRISEVAEAILTMLKAYHLIGSLQFRLPGSELTLDHSGEASPLEASIISHVRTLGDISSFRNRAAFNFGRASVLINNMPLEDPERCARLRDHLAIAVETVDAKISTLLSEQDNKATKADIGSLLHDFDSALRAFGEKYRQARFQGIEAMRLLAAELDVEFASLGMQEAQEERITRVIQARSDQLVESLDIGAQIEQAFGGLSTRLQRIQDAIAP